MSILRDILTETDKGGRTKFSQGRIYLFISFAVFFILNILLTTMVLSNKELKEQETLMVIASNLKWALGSFALYVLGGKGIGAFRDKQTGIENNYNDRNYGRYGGRMGGYDNYRDEFSSNYHDMTNDSKNEGKNDGKNEGKGNNEDKGKNGGDQDYYSQENEEVN